MAVVEGLNLRGSRYYVRILIPDERQDLYGKERVNLALGTSDRREATLLATLKRAYWLAEFEQKRKEQNLTPVDSVSPDLAGMLAEMVRAQVLATDDELRENERLWAEMADATGTRHASLRISSDSPAVVLQGQARGHREEHGHPRPARRW